jgi:ParB family chromosome partitioning protein
VEFGFKKTHVYQLLEFAEVTRNIEFSAMAENIVLPVSERVARPLTRLEPEEQPIVWQRAVDSAPNGKITAAHVQSVVDSYTEPDVEDYPGEDCHDEYAYYDKYIKSSKITTVDEWGIEEYHDRDAVALGEEEILEKAETIKLSLAAANHAVSDDPDYDGDEWYTPTEIIDAAKSVMGEIDLDPASCESAQNNVCAKMYYTKDDDSLRDDCEWFGNVWVNPPYSMPLIKKFVSKLVDQYEKGNVSQAIILTNNSSDTSWFHMLLEKFPACFTYGRIKFWRPNLTEFGTRQGQTIFYLGDNVNAFAEKFSEIGRVVFKI